MTFEGKPDVAIELNTYLILEVYHSRPRAIWRYILFAFSEWRDRIEFKIEFRLRLFWYQHVKGMDRQGAIFQAHKEAEDDVFDRQKGESHGKSH